MVDDKSKTLATKPLQLSGFACGFGHGRFRGGAGDIDDDHPNY